MRPARWLAGILLAIVALALGAAFRLVTAQDTTRIKVYTDSIRYETCRGGTLSPSGLICTGATSAPRVTVLRRHATAIEAAMRATPSVPRLARIAITLDHTATTVWRSGRIATFASDNEILCARVEVAGVSHLGSSSVVARAVRPDSVQWRVLPDTGAALRARCQPHGITGAIWPVTWEATAVQVVAGSTARHVLPFAVAVVR